MPWTRKELEEEFHLSDRTVRRTLKAIGCDINQETYSDDEYEAFRTAREMLNNGASFDEVTKHFRGDDSASDDEETPKRAPSSLPLGDIGALSELIARRIAERSHELVQDEIDAAVEAIIEFLPQMTIQSFGKRIHVVDDAYDEFRVRRKEERHRQMVKYYTVDATPPQGLPKSDKDDNYTEEEMQE